MRVMVYGNGHHKDGTGRLLTSLSQALRELGDDVSFQLRDSPRGIIPKLFWMFGGIVKDARQVVRSDAIVVHSALSLNLPLLAWARLMGKPAIGFVWDIYPASTKEAGGIRNPLLLWAYGVAEKVGYELCNRLLVPTEDYVKALPDRARSKTVEFGLWITESPRAISNRRLQDARIRLAFAGQLNSIRGLDDTIERILESYPEESFDLDIYSADTIPLSLTELSESTSRFSVTHRGYHEPEILRELLPVADFGVVALNPGFSLPAFPSKIMTYVAIGVPVIYSGPELRGITSFLHESGLGLVIGREDRDQNELALLRSTFAESRRVYLTGQRQHFESFREIIRDTQRPIIRPIHDALD